MSRQLSKLFFAMCNPAPGDSATLDSANDAQLQQLLHAAQTHDVIPAFRASLEKSQYTASTSEGELKKIKDTCDKHIYTATLQTMMLRRLLGKLRSLWQAEAIGAVEIKGVDFADNLYPHSGLRHFSDLDIITKSDDFDRLDKLFIGAGLVPLIEQNLKHRDPYGEKAYDYTDKTNLTLRVELHWNLVNSPALRPGISMQYDDIAANGEISPAARFVIAAIHGATSHQFDHAKFVFDLLLAARQIASDDAEISAAKKLIAQTGSAAIVSTSLHVLDGIFDEEPIKTLQNALALPKPNRLAKFLLNADMADPFAQVLMKRARTRGYRQLLKRPMSLLQNGRSSGS